MVDLAPYRRVVIALFELAVVAATNYFAFLLRFDGDIPLSYLALFVQTLPFVIAVRALIFIPFRLYEGLWRYTSIWDLRNIVAAVLSSTALIHVVLNSVLNLRYPRSIVLIDALLLTSLMTGVRLTRRIYRELGTSKRDKGILIYGAGDAGEMVVRDIKNNSFYGMEPIGFIDDDSKKVGRRIHGIPVLGSSSDLNTIMKRRRIHEVLIAMPRASATQLRHVVKMLEPFKVPIMTLPNLKDLLDGKVTVNQIRNLAIEDLLPRTPVGLNVSPVRELITGRRVVVTGAGGSIGSELCRQIASMRPEILILLERHEHSVYTVHKNLAKTAECGLVVKTLDVTDRNAVKAVLREYEPQIVFHAAAHKHVPLMEANPCEAIKNNVRGTRIMAEEAAASGVQRFILISTDKAVNPSSVMGASKCIAESIIQSMAGKASTCFNAVRFGNVLGSNGSVVPLFVEQIQTGGPVTVTHPEMRRYFMLIPEAVQLVLHAATLNETSAIYVLDMGDEFKVVDLARNLIRLSGHVPDEDIQIQFIGMRFGEKLSETLVGSNETVEPSPITKIQRVRSRRLHDPLQLGSDVSRLEAAAIAGQDDEVIRLLHQLIPNFEHTAIKSVLPLAAAATMPISARASS